MDNGDRRYGAIWQRAPLAVIHTHPTHLHNGEKQNQPKTKPTIFTPTASLG